MARKARPEEQGEILTGRVDRTADLPITGGGVSGGGPGGEGVFDEMTGVAGKRRQEAAQPVVLYDAQGNPVQTVMPGTQQTNPNAVPVPEPVVAPVVPGLTQAEIDAQKAAAELAAREAAARAQLEKLIADFHDIATGKAKSPAELEFEQQYQTAKAHAQGAMLNVRGLQQGGTRSRETQIGLNTMQNQDQQVLQQQARSQAGQAEAELSGVLASGDYDLASINAATRLGNQAIDVNSMTNAAALEFYKSQGRYDLGMKRAGQTLSNDASDAAWWNQIAQGGMGAAGTVAGLGQKGGLWGSK